MTTTQAKRIVNALLTELDGRRGFKVIQSIMEDREVYEEMYGALVEAVVHCESNVEDPSKSYFHPQKSA